MSADYRFGSHQRGVTTLLITSLLLVLMLMISIYSARESVSVQRVARNYKQAIASDLQSEAMLSHALAQLQRLGPMIGSFHSGFRDTNYTVELSPYLRTDSDTHIRSQQVDIYHQDLMQSQIIDWVPAFKKTPNVALTVGTNSTSNTLFEYYFGFLPEEKNQLKILATQRVTNCTDIRTPAVGLVWVTGTCDLQFTMNDWSKPVMLYIENGSVNLEAGVVFNGIIVIDHFNHDDPLSLNISLHSEINGALLMFGEFGVNLEPTSIKFNEAMVRELIDSHHLHYLFRRKGGWRDF